MFRRLAPIGALFWLLIPYGAGAETPATVDRIATLIENNYFDPDKARTIARELRHIDWSARAGGSGTPRDPASSITQYLQPFDRHFRVAWSPDADESSRRLPCNSRA